MNNFNEQSLLEKTLHRLETLYFTRCIKPGMLAKIGLKPGWTVVLGDGMACGTAFRFSGPHNVYKGLIPTNEELQQLIGQTMMSVAERYLYSSSIPLRSIAVACLSALSQQFIEESSLNARGFSVLQNRGFIENALRPDDVVTLIGYGGMLQNVLGKCKEIHVADMRPADVLLTTIIGDKIEYAPSQVILHGAEDDEELLGRSDVVIITASTLVNGTLDELIRYAANARVILLYGPSASMIPDVLCEAGVTCVMSHNVSNPSLFIEGLNNDMNMESSLRNGQKYQTMVMNERL
jgi:uncharacterized protein (DUF4213/DUF364 family)